MFQPRVHRPAVPVVVRLATGLAKPVETGERHAGGGSVRKGVIGIHGGILANAPVQATGFRRKNMTPAGIDFPTGIRRLDPP